jgi:uncharacterized membrane protein
MTKLSMIETSKEMIKEFERLIKSEEVKKKNKWLNFKNYSKNFDIRDYEKNDPQALELWESYIESDTRIGSMKIAIQKIENLLFTLDEIK